VGHENGPLSRESRSLRRSRYTESGAMIATVTFAAPPPAAGRGSSWPSDTRWSPPEEYVCAENNVDRERYEKLLSGGVKCSR